jgi:hypothetical protein
VSTLQTLTLPVEDLLPGDLVEMEPVYVAYDETESADFVVSQSEFGEILEAEEEGDDIVILHFQNLGSFAVARGHIVSADREVA